MTTDHIDPPERRPDPARLSALAARFHLAAGHHASRDEGMCAMELIAFLEGQPHSDRPSGVSATVGDYVRFLNDHMRDDVRQRLLPFLPRLIGAPSGEQASDEHFAWAAVRIFAPAALRAAGRRRMASRLQAAPSLPDAKEIASGILERLQPASGRQAPACLQAFNATHQAFRAVAARRGYTAGYCAASAAFHARKAGAPGIWDLAFEVLDGALVIGATQPLPARWNAAERAFAERTLKGAARQVIDEIGGSRPAAAAGRSGGEPEPMADPGRPWPVHPDRAQAKRVRRTRFLA